MESVEGENIAGTEEYSNLKENDVKPAYLKESDVKPAYFCESPNHIILYTGYDKGKIKRLCVETTGCAVLDSACPSNVAGEKWLNDFTENWLNATDRKKIKKSTGKRFFRFGDNPPIKSKEEVQIPICIGDTNLTLVIDIVEADVPLLLSKRQMKEYGMILDLSKDEVRFKGKNIWLEESSSGHYMLPLVADHAVRDIYAINLTMLKGAALKNAICKLHKQFGHPTKDKLKHLMKDAKIWNDDMETVLSNIIEQCQICKLYKKTPDRPVVAYPMGNFFNDALCVDLKSLSREGWILHMIDMHTRYTRSILVDRKFSSGIIDKIMKDWVGIFGVPRKLMSDNGGEFTSDEMKEVSSYLNVIKYTTAAEAPWQNGLCERVHQVTDMILLKLRATYPKVDLDVLLAWANMARNSLQMYNGFSSHQLVFGVNPNLPNILTDELPAMTETTGSEVFAKHLNLLHSSRDAFIKADASERVKRALRHKLRCAQQVYHRDQRVYYKRDNSERWLGPAKVMFQDGKVVFVRHGNEYYRVSVNRLNSAEKC